MTDAPSSDSETTTSASTQAWAQRQKAIRRALELEYRRQLDEAAARAKNACRPELLAWAHDELTETAATVDAPESESAHHDMRLVLSQVLEKLAISYES